MVVLVAVVLVVGTWALWPSPAPADVTGGTSAAERTSTSQPRSGSAEPSGPLEQALTAAVDRESRLSEVGAPPDLDGGDAGDDPRAAEAARFLADNARLADELVDRFCEEARAMEGGSLPPAQAQRTRDAWAYMGVRIDWEGGDRPPGLLRLGSPLRQRLREYGDDWPMKIRDYDLEGLDFNWMAELQAFDHWDVLRDLRVREPSGTNFMAASIPNFFELMNWTRLRFGRAMGVGDWASASSDVRHLAFLLRTTGLVVADMVAYRILPPGDPLGDAAVLARRLQGHPAQGVRVRRRQPLLRAVRGRGQAAEVPQGVATRAPPAPPRTPAPPQCACRCWSSAPAPSNGRARPRRSCSAAPRCPPGPGR